MFSQRPPHIIQEAVNEATILSLVPCRMEQFETDKLFSRQLVEALTRMAGRPWREIRRGSAINELWLAQQLSAFGIQSRTMRIGDSVGRGYYLEDFTDARGQYLPRRRRRGSLNR